jgi:hypothetical protein
MSFFERIPYDAARELEEWSRLAFELREVCRQVLAPYGVATPEELLELLERGDIANAASAGSDYLAASFLVTAKEDARTAIADAARALGS